MAGGERIPGTPRYRHQLLKNPGTEAFFPNFLLKEWIAGAIFLLAFMLWVVFNPVALGPRANPDDTSFIPVPDWYFLFLYQLLKYYPGSAIVFGTVLVPAVASSILIFAPWLDTRKARHPYKRPMATSAMVLVTFLTIWLTNEAWVQHNAEIASSGGGPVSTALPTVPKIPVSQIHLVDTQMAGYKLFENTCAACHGTSAEGVVGPPIYAIGKYWNTQQLTAFVSKGAGVMPARGGLTSDAEVKTVVAWLVNQKG